MRTVAGWSDRFNQLDMTGNLGYWVLYEDGWQSWSPAKAFEEGYTKL